MSPGPSATVPPSPTATVDYLGQNLPPGVSVLDVAPYIAGVEVAPSGMKLLAVEPSDNAADSIIRVLRTDGTRLGSHTGRAATWIDDEHLLIVDTDPGTGSGALVWAADGSTPERLPGVYSGVISNGHGTAILTAKGPQLPFRVWRDGKLGDPIQGKGDPLALSPDGTTVALGEDDGAAFGEIGLACTGCYTPDLVRVSFLRLTDGRIVSDPKAPPTDANLGFVFSRDGRRLAAGDELFDPATGRGSRTPGDNPMGWTPDGRVVYQGEDGSRARLWRPGDAAMTQLTGIPTYGAKMDQVALLGLAGDPLHLASLDITLGAERTVRLTADHFSVTWLPNGDCLVVAAPALLGQDQRLLLVSPPR